MRLVLAPSGEVAVDAAGGGFGRGAHVHARVACLQQAVARGLQRATKGNAKSVSVVAKEGGALTTTEGAPLTARALGQAIEVAMSRRIVGLLGTAVRTRKVRIGADAATGAWGSGEASLLVVATDAGSVAGLMAVRDAVENGAAVAWGTKDMLAAAVSRPEKSGGVPLVAIMDTRLSAALHDAVEKTMGVRGNFGEKTASKRPARETAGGAATGARQASRAKPPDGQPGSQSAGSRNSVEAHRAGRASGRQLRRAHGKQAVVERSE